MLHRLEKEARRLPLVLSHETAVSEHRRQVLGKYAPVKRDQVPLGRRLRELLRLLLAGGLGGRGGRVDGAAFQGGGAGVPWEAEGGRTAPPGAEEGGRGRARRGGAMEAEAEAQAGRDGQNYHLVPGQTGGGGRTVESGGGGV